MFKVSEQVDDNGVSQRLLMEHWIRRNDILTVTKQGTNYYLRLKEYVYILHPTEEERFEAFLRGDDDPMWALVDELRNHPSIGIYPKIAAEDFSHSHSGGAKRPRNENERGE